MTRKNKSASTQARQAQQRQVGNANKKIRIHRISLITGLCLLACLIGIFAWGWSLKKSNVIYPNVHVAGVDVGGMTRLDAVDAVERQAAAAYTSSSLTVRLPDRILTFTPEQSGVAVNAEDAVDQAIRHGRRGNPFTALAGWLESHRTEYHIDLQTMLELDTDYIRDLIRQVADQVSQKLVQSRVDYDPDEEIFTITVGTPARNVDADGLYDAVVNAFMTGDFSPLDWNYEEIPCDPVDMSGYFDLYCTQVEDARYDPEAGFIVPEVPGYGFDPEAVAEKLEQAQPGEVITVRMENFEPEVTREMLEQEMFPDILHSVSSPYVTNEARTTNLRLACEAINGMILDPDDVFSFNAAVGERTAEKGYLGATVYAGNGASESQLGGGICQVASTIYYGTLHLNVKQVQREPHMYAVTYVPMGMDAAIYWDIGQDYKFKNTLSHPMQILAWLENGKVNITFRGTKETTNRVEMSYEVLETYPYEEVEEVDETKPADYRKVTVTPYTGYKVVTYKTIYDETGKQLSREIETYSTYKKRDRVTVVGPHPGQDPDADVPTDPRDDPNSPWYDPNNEQWYDPNTGQWYDPPAQ